MSSPSSAQPIQQPSSTDDSIASPALNAEEGVAPAPPPADGVNHPSDDSDSESGDDDLEPAPAREWRRAKTLKDIGLHVCSPSKYKLIIII